MRKFDLKPNKQKEKRAAVNRRFRQGIGDFIRNLLEMMHRRRTVLISLSCVVVFLTTYLLILPAFTLDKEEAAEQGGVDVPVSEEVVEKTEESDEAEDADSTDTDEEETDTESESTTSDSLLYEGDNFKVSIDDTKSVLPEDASVKVEEIDKSKKEYTKQYKELYDDALAAVRDDKDGKKVASFSFAKFYDISILDGEETVQPKSAVDVTIAFDEALQKELKAEDAGRVRIIHFAEDKETGEITAEVLKNKDVEVNTDNKDKLTDTTFKAEGFSVYAVVYTVDFHYEIDGETYEYSLEGGGSIGLRELVDALDVLKGKDISKEDFIDGIETVEFSDEELIKVVKVDEDTTAGELKDKLGLNPDYSKELSENEIAEFDTKKYEAPDWALISLKAFDTEETLTLTMNDGSELKIKVTDALHVDPDQLVGKEIVIYDKTENRALTSDWEQNTYRTEFKSVEYAGEGSSTPNNAHWIVEKYNGNYYLKTKDGKYLNIDNTNVKLVDSGYEATALTIGMGGNPDYRIYAKNDVSKILTYSENNEYDGFFAAPGGTGGTGTTRRWLGIDYAVNESEPVGDWMLYFDDDFEEITIHVGETVSLRPYNKWEWKEGNTDVQTAHWNIGGKDNNFWNQISSSDKNGDRKTEWDDGGNGENSAAFHWSAYVKKDDQLVTHYWAVQGRATKTGVYYLTNTKNGKTIKVNVVDGEPVNKPATISNTADIKVNLFDYDRFYKLDPESNNNLANNSNNKSDSTNKMSGNSHFYFLSSGSGNNNNESWNSYTKDKANTGIVKDQLDSEGYPELSAKGTSLKYLFDTSKTQWNGGADSNNPDGMISYPDVNGMFQKDTDGYYYYNSNTNYFYYDADAEKSYLYEHTYTQIYGKEKSSLENDKPIGFFPFHDYDATDDLYVNQNHNLNHHVGMSMEIPFTMNNDKLDENGKPIKFEFTGDDDLWVFAEWEDESGNKHSKLLLDIGGIHQPVYGYIDFTSDKSSSSDSLGLQLNVDYKLKVYYLERGGCDSNLAIRFNIPLTNIGDIPFTKQDSETFGPLPGAVFGLYKESSCSADSIIRQATSDNDGHVLFSDLSIGTYYLKEITPPNGYKANPHVYTVEVKAKNKSEISEIDGKQAKSDYSYIIDNTPIKLNVKKVWLNTEGNNHPNQVYFKLYKKGSPDTEITDKPGYVNNKGYVLNDSNDWNMSFNGLADGQYYVVEETLQGYTALYAAKEVSTDSDPDVKKNAVDALADEDGNLTILNKPTVGALKLTKVVLINGQAPDTSEKKALTNGTYEFAVAGVVGTDTAGETHTIKITFTDGKATKYQIDANAEQTVAGTDNTWSVVLNDLKAGDYTITETPPTNGMILKSVTGGKQVDFDTKVATVTVTAGDTTPTQAPAQVEFKNNCAVYEVTIVKADTANITTKLGGAEFDLYEENSVEEKDGQIVVKSGAQPINSSKLVTSSSECEDKGKVSLGRLPEGTYYLFETKAPDGYNLMEEPVRIVVSDGRVSLMQGTREEVGTISQNKTELKVLNSPGAELPHTGGIGTTVFYFLGSLLLIGGAVGIISRRRVSR